MTRIRFGLAVLAAGVALLLAAPRTGAQTTQTVGAIFASAARTVTTNSSAFTNATQANGISLTLDVTAASGSSPTLDVKLQSQDPVSGQWTDLSGAVFMRAVTTGTWTLMVYPGPEGSGQIRNVTGADPAAGAEVSDTVTANARWRLYSAKVTLVTDATVANRSPSLTLDDGTTEYARYSSSTNQTASTTFVDTWGNGLGAGNGNTANVGNLLPTYVILTGGHRIKTVTQAIVAGDNFGAPQYLVEEWIGNRSSVVLPRTWRAVATIAGSSPSFTFSVGGFYLK